MKLSLRVAIAVVVVALVAGLFTATGAAKRKAAKKPKVAQPKVATTLDVRGTWSANPAGAPELQLHQQASRVWGKDQDGHLVRGAWVDGRLILLWRKNYKGEEQQSCAPPSVVVLRSKGSTTRLEGFEVTASGAMLEKILMRASADPGSDFSYPYGAELRVCGGLPIYDLSFEAGTGKLEGTAWPILAAVASMLSEEPALNIRIMGHTDPTGDAGKATALSQHQAEAVKKALTGRYQVEASRIVAKGLGPEEPLATNETEDGRAANRRVEILVAR